MSSVLCSFANLNSRFYHILGIAHEPTHKTCQATSKYFTHIAYLTLVIIFLNVFEPKLLWKLVGSKLTYNWRYFSNCRSKHSLKQSTKALVLSNLEYTVYWVLVVSFSWALPLYLHSALDKFWYGKHRTVYDTCQDTSFHILINCHGTLPSDTHLPFSKLISCKLNRICYWLHRKRRADTLKKAAYPLVLVSQLKSLSYWKRAIWLNPNFH